MPVEVREIVRRPQAAGFVLSQGGRHMVMKHPDGRMTVVPRHRGDVPTGTVRAIEKQTGVPILPR